jgi:short-subunit dehydrogenase
MKVLLTGAFGNIGTNTIEALRQQGHQVTAFDLPTKANIKSAKRFKNKIKICWGDIRLRRDIAAALLGQDVVIHLAAIIPPDSERNPERAEEVNIGGTHNLLEAAKGRANPPKLIFSSSVSVFGCKFDCPPPRTVEDSLEPSDNYSRHKIVCEEMIKSSGIRWAILRFPAVPSLRSMGIDPIMFEISLSTRIEFLHPKDAGLALANAVSSDDVWGKILLMGGGKEAQFEYCDYVGRTLESVGIGRLPSEAFGCRPFYTDWMDTSESQRILQYQHHTFDDYLLEFKANLGLKGHFIPLVRPLIRRSLLRRSPYMPPGADSGRKGSGYWKDKVALVTGASSGIGEATARRLAHEGLKVALVARRKDRLLELAERIRSQGGQSLVIAADLTREDERSRVVDEIRAAWGKIDVLINNAGFAWYGFGADMPWDVASRMIELNVKAAVHFTLLVIRRMRAYNSGHVINVSSIAGSFPQQGIMLYGATKAFIDSFTTSLYRETRGSNVHVSVIKPGAVKTELYRVAENDPTSLSIPAEGLAVSAEKVVNSIWGLLNRPRRRVFVPALLRVVPWIEYCFGWFIDKLGPLLLRRAMSPAKTFAK